jgi:hypothetical protein
MEYKKHRAAEIETTTKGLKLNLSTAFIPPILGDSKPAKNIEKQIKALNAQTALLKERLAKVFNELEVLEKVYENFAGALSVTQTEYETFLTQVKHKQEQMNKRHNVLDKEISELMTSKADRETIFKLQVERDDLIRDKQKIDKQLKRYLDKLEALPKIPFDVLQEFEISNLTRLGLIKEDFGQNIEPMPTRDSIYQRRISQGASILDVNYVPWGMKLVITELGEMFIKTCQEKGSSKKHT